MRRTFYLGYRLLPLGMFSLLIGSWALAQTDSTSQLDPTQPFADEINRYGALWQQDPRCGFPDNGNYACTMTAFTNGLMWFAENGYPNLLPQTNAPLRTPEQRNEAIVQLARAFTTKPYASFGSTGMGATPTYAGKGATRYIQDHGYQVAQMEYRAVRVTPLREDETLDDEPFTGNEVAGADTAAKKPGESLIPLKKLQIQPAFTLNEIKTALRSGAVVILSVGRYSPVPNLPDTYKRASGHAMTLVGYGLDPRGKNDPAVIITHDPARKPTNKGTWPNRYVRLTPMAHGHFSENVKGRTRTGKSWVNYCYEIDQAKANQPITLLNGATIIRLKEQQP